MAIARAHSLHSSGTEITVSESTDANLFQSLEDLLELCNGSGVNRPCSTSKLDNLINLVIGSVLLVHVLCVISWMGKTHQCSLDFDGWCTLIHWPNVYHLDRSGHKDWNVTQTSLFSSRWPTVLGTWSKNFQFETDALLAIHRWMPNCHLSWRIKQR